MMAPSRLLATRACTLAAVAGLAGALDEYGCTGRPIIPAAWVGSGSYWNSSCFEQGLRCRIAVGNWTVLPNVVLKSGNAGSWSPGVDHLMPRGFMYTLCPDRFSEVTQPDGSKAALVEFYSSEDKNLAACALLQHYDPSRPSDPGLTMSINMDFHVSNCNGDIPLDTFMLDGFTWNAPRITRCPGLPAVPPSFVHPAVPIFPSTELDPNDGWYGGLTPWGTAESYGFGIINVTSCALNLTILSHNATSNTTTFALYLGDAASGKVNGCNTYVRIGRDVAFAQRFWGNYDMDPSCGWANPATGANLCCWNWTAFSWDSTNDGSQVKALFDYFPEGWEPYPSPPTKSGAGHTAGVSATGTFLLALAVAALAGVVGGRDGLET